MVLVFPSNNLDQRFLAEAKQQGTCLEAQKLIAPA